MHNFDFLIEDWMKEERIRREELFHNLFTGAHLAHIPLEIKIDDPKHHPKEYYFDREMQLEDTLSSALLTWQLEDSTDMIPALFPDIGCSCIATAFGGEYYFGGREDQTAGIKKPPISDLCAWAETDVTPDQDSEWLREGLLRVSMYAEAGKGFIPVTGLDAAGGLNVAADLVGLTDLLVLMVDAPDAVHALLRIIQDTYIKLIEQEIIAAGGLSNMTSTDFYAGWSPDGHKGHCSDDISAMFGPDLYAQFSAPYHALVYDRYGAGGLHNCGPNPCHEAYVASKPHPRFLDLAEKYSRNDLEKFKRSLKGKAFIRWGSEETDLDKIVSNYQEYMDILAPYVILVPTYTLKTVEEGKELYRRLRPLSEEFAKRMEYGFD